MRKILIIGAGPEQLPAIKKAKEMGLYVITTDMNPGAVGFNFADKYYIVSTNDYEGNLKVALKEGISGVLTLVSETAIPVIGRICEALKLPGFNYETALNATNKNSMHRLMEKSDVPMPKSIMITNGIDEKIDLEGFSFPLVIKPSDSSGQRGVKIIDNLVDIDKHISEAIKYSTDNRALIEEYMEGPEINVTTVVIDGKDHVLSLSDRVTYSKQHFGIAYQHIALRSFQKNNWRTLPALQ